MLGVCIAHAPSQHMAEPAPAMADLLPCWAYYPFHCIKAIRLQVAPADCAVICSAAIGGEHIAVP